MKPCYLCGSTGYVTENISIDNARDSFRNVTCYQCEGFGFVRPYVAPPRRTLTDNDYRKMHAIKKAEGKLTIEYLMPR